MSNLKPKHTPGICSICTKQIYDHFGVMLCNECRSKLPPRFAVAPELLEALESTVTALRAAVADRIEDKKYAYELKLQIFHAERAVAKARGES